MSYSFNDSQEVNARTTKFADTTTTRTRRTIKSCGECRRRKQKVNEICPPKPFHRNRSLLVYPTLTGQCDQEQPCSNCRRRFPEPICDYGPRRSAAPEFATSPTAEALSTPSTSSGRPVTSRKQAPWAPISRSGIASKVSGHETHTLKLNLSSRGHAGESTQPQNEQEAHTARKALVALQLDGVVYQCHLTGPVQNILHLPVPPTTQNAMLICKFSELMTALKGSFHGDSDPDNPYVLHYLPWCVQSPLLALSTLYTTARTIMRTGLVDQRSSMLAKGSAISKLNEYLRSDDDWGREEVLAAIMQFVAVEWVFSELEVAQSHLKGFRDIIRLRGGFPSHGVGVLITKSAFLHDSLIALWSEESPIMTNSFEFEGILDRPSGAGRFKVRYNCPLGPSSVAFRSCEGVLGIHPATASILDDIRFLIDLALDAPLNPSPAQARKLAATATWILDRIRNLDPKYPERLDRPSEGGDAELGCQSTDDSTWTEVKPHSLLPKFPSHNSMAQAAKSPGVHKDEEDISSRPSEDYSPADSTTVASSDGTTCATTGEAPKPDALYIAVRLAALIYAEAIAKRQPLSWVCSSSDALALLSTTWRIPLPEWRGVIGVFIFMLLSIYPTFRWIDTPPKNSEENNRRWGNRAGMSQNPSPIAETEEINPNGENDDARKLERDAKEMAAEKLLKPHHTFVKSIVQAGMTQMAIEDWPLCIKTMKRALALQKWLERRKM
ncbi:hypothetical protein PpBr36_07299 [Pyricularia pennisetigena]|uniref:hypothetical protein n=1 Tax=Pyricularia pennisetigena TaxID=1578925 RepID=UPI001152A392|nr:hypothetical protein PpBr36_07299 [Pyricularia pennisetigena]TLS25039.1 hypothetical protein PpBr36_07299 [Pyricularia pennisetigena]